jgi:branched-chain amino acid transport system permease protein
MTATTEPSDPTTARRHAKPPTLQVPGPSRRASLLRTLALIAAVAALIQLPQQYKPFMVGRFSQVIVYAIAMLGLSLLTGFTGQISVGHGAFYGAGAYTTAILAADHGWPLLATIPAAAAVCFVLGVIAGLPALRIQGFYLALTTLALAAIFPTIIQHYSSVTGGTQGKRVPALKSPIDGLANDQYQYYVALAVALLCYLAVRNLVRSRVGRGLIAVRDNETAATVVGVNVAAYKLAAFGISALLAGVAGSLSTLAVSNYVDSGSYKTALSITLLVGLVVGGASSLAGPVLGAIFVEWAPDWLGDGLGFEAALTPVAYGVLLVALMLLAPGGLTGLGRRLHDLWARRRSPGTGPQGKAAPAAGGGPLDR